ncbi:Type I restriction-modification system, specificity subunit S [Vibrio aestuarianus]|nr:Type I restriction-modification system, specificity subunit S [Vibrio aestuarianus]
MVRSQNIPNGWAVTLLDSAAERCSGHTPSKSFSEYWNGGIKWISLADSFRLDNGYVYETDKEISQLGIDNSSAVIHPKGTVVLSRDAGVGKSGVMAEPMAVSQHFIAWKCDANRKVHNWFLYNWLQFHKSTFERQAVGSTIKTIGLPFFKKLKIALPPYVEQRKIAQILSTWDRGIATTEKLIDASKQQKKALMQQLLTGKKRLIDPETGKAFQGEWEEVRLSALSIKGKGNFTDGDWIESPYIADSGCRLIQTGNIGVGCFKNKAKKYISEASFVELKCKEVKVNDLLICRLAEPAGRACVVPDIGERKMLTSVDVTIMRVDKTKSSPEYLSYFFSLDHTLYTVTTLCGGSTRSRISRTNLGRMKIFLPALNEQQKIAAVLSAADKEIELLEAKLAHFMQEKKALMQQLLTGKRRVKVAETEAA